MITDPTIRVLSLVDHDRQFELSSTYAGVDTFILNKFDLANPNFIEDISDLVFSDGSSADFVAKCQCGETEGNNKLGMRCPVCDTEVSYEDLLDNNNLVSKNWLSSPPELVCGWLTPKVYLILADWLRYDKGRRTYIDDILDVDSMLPYDLQEVITGRGFQYFYDNFDRILEFFYFNHPVISKKPQTQSMRLFLQLNRNLVFCHYVPILNSAISPIMNADSGGSNKKRYSDVTSDHILKAAVSLSRLEYAPKKKNRMLHVERTTYKAFKDIILYFEEATKQYISTKKAIPRTHIYGSRFHWSFRGVVTPIVGPHHYYELHIPWRMGVNTLRVHILGILCRDYKLPINAAMAKHRRALQIVDPEIKTIMEGLILDSPNQGIPCVWDRPPSIRDGSVMLKHITKIKDDIEDSSVGITPLDAALPNV